jgi:hypothetical protein
MPVTVPLPASLAARRTRPAPGLTVGYKKGGKTKHADEAADRKLFKSMLRKEESKEKRT